MNNKSFTLIELLVVIAIIGLLSSVVLVSMGGVKGKARVSKGLEFSQTLLNVLGSEAIGRWQFESIADEVALDSSGYNRNGTVCGGITLAAGVEGKTGNSYAFDGLNDHVAIGPSDPFEYRGGDLTISFWANPNSTETSGGQMVSKPWNGSGQYNYWVEYPSNKLLRVNLYGNIGWQTDTSQTLEPGNWYHIAVVLTGASQKVEIYINGKLVKNTIHNITSWTPPFGDGNRSLAIGTLYGEYGCDWLGNNGFSFDGKMDEVNLYAKSLSATEIQNQYAKGLERHKDLVIK